MNIIVLSGHNGLTQGIILLKSEGEQQKGKLLTVLFSTVWVMYIGDLCDFKHYKLKTFEYFWPT